jgi:hypothetical protein
MFTDEWSPGTRMRNSAEVPAALGVFIMNFR